MLAKAKRNAFTWWEGKSPDGSVRDLGMGLPAMDWGGAASGAYVHPIAPIGTDGRTVRAKRNAESLADPEQYWAGKDLAIGAGRYGKWISGEKTGSAPDSTPPVPIYERWRPAEQAKTEGGYRSESHGFGGGRRKAGSGLDVPPAGSGIPIGSRRWRNLPADVRARDIQIRDMQGRGPGKQLDAPYGIIGKDSTTAFNTIKQSAINYAEGKPLPNYPGNYPNVPGSNERRYEMGTGVGYQRDIYVKGKGIVTNPGRPKNTIRVEQIFLAFSSVFSK